MTYEPRLGRPAPLLPEEKGRRACVVGARRAEIERYCAQALLSGSTQLDLISYFGASRSRVSRWCIDGLRQHGCGTDHRLLKVRGVSLVQMMWARIDLRGPGECWPWRGVIKSNGYGSLNFKGKTRNAHRLVFETLIGAVPQGLVLDHTCENKACVNPSHLQPVAQSANIVLTHARRVA